MKRLLCVLCLMAASCAQAEEFTTKVIAVLDGDTVLIRRGSGVTKIRLVDIDAPEKDQPFGASSAKSLSGMVLNKPVKVVSQAMDQYGRMVAHLYVNGLDVNTEQIRRGMAWEYSHYHSNRELKTLQAEAQAAPRGLWAMGHPTPPWEWRKAHPSAAHAAPDAAVQPGVPGCERKPHCAQLSSCEEARHYLTVCGFKYLDGDGDGTPCEKLCPPPHAKK